MAHVKGHPEDKFRQFLEHSLDDIGGFLPSAAEFPKRDKFGRVLTRRALPATLGSSLLGLAVLAALQNQGSRLDQGRRGRMILRELDAQRAIEKNPEAGTGNAQQRR